MNTTLMNRISLTVGAFCLALLAGWSLPVRAEEGHKEAAKEAGHAEGEEVESRGGAVGPGKAVEGFEHGKRIKLSEKARTRLGIKTGKASWTAGAAVVPVEAVVCIKEKRFVFVSRKGWYEYRPVKVAARDGKSIVLAEGLKRREEIVLQGAWTLRVIELDMEAGEKGGEHRH